MTTFAEVPIGAFFTARNGKAKFIRDYMDRHAGSYPVYSASLAQPFGHVDSFDYDGRFLTWVMNGYGGRVQEVDGKFSVNRDRGVLIPREEVRTPDMAFLRFAMEPQLVAAAVGRREDGRLNEYTKLYPEDALDVTISLPVADGEYDYDRMAKIGDKLRRVERAQEAVRAAQDPLRRAMFAMDIQEPSFEVSLGDPEFFALSIGKRVLRSEHTDSGVPVYSSNALVPFGHIAASNLESFAAPSLLWGIDGNFDWNLVPAGTAFATTDHCGRLQLVDDRLDPGYVFAYLKATRWRYGFDRVFRSSLKNMKDVVSVVVPAEPDGSPSMSRQVEIARAYAKREEARTASLAAVADVLKARMTAEI